MSNHSTPVSTLEKQHKGNKKSDSKISYFNSPITNTRPSQELTLEEIYIIVTQDSNLKRTTEKGRSLQPAKRKKFKANNFPYGTFNGTFSYRNEKSLKQPSGYMSLDLDHLSDVEAVKQRLINDKSLPLVMLFVSPSGEGLKGVVRIDPTLIRVGETKKMLDLWDAVNAYMEQHYSDLITPNKEGEYIDGACKDLSRATFLCHDPDAYFNSHIAGMVDADFLANYPPLKTEKTKVNEAQPDTYGMPIIERLAARHLLPSDNHHPQLLHFASACANFRQITQNQCEKYLIDNVDFSNSAHNSTAKIKKEVADIYRRYRPTFSVAPRQKTSEGVTNLGDNGFYLGIFHFKFDKKGRLVLHGLTPDGIRKYLKDLGYFKMYLNPQSAILIKRDGAIIEEVGVENIKDVITNTALNSGGLEFEYNGLPYSFSAQQLADVYLRQSHLFLNQTWLQHLCPLTTPVLKDTKDTIFFPFKNGLIPVQKDGIGEILEYDKLDNVLIWKSQIIDRDFTPATDYKEGAFAKFVHNVCAGDDSRVNNLMAGVGYLTHGFLLPSQTKAIIINDEEITDKDTPQGGTGKGVIAQAISKVKPTVKIDGKQFNPGNKFAFQRIEPSTQVVWFDDPTPDFDFSLLFSAITDGLTIERKYLPELYLRPEDSPKWLIASNTILDNAGSSNKRRQYIIELSSYYSQKIITGSEEPIREEHGGIFFSDDWQADEWNRFFTWMLSAARYYLAYGLPANQTINTGRNLLMQHTNADFVAWCDYKDFQPGKNYETKTYFTGYVWLYYGENSNFPQRRFTNYLKRFAAAKGWDLQIKRSNGIDYFSFNKRRKSAQVHKIYPSDMYLCFLLTFLYFINYIN